MRFVPRLLLGAWVALVPTLAMGAQNTAPQVTAFGSLFQALLGLIIVLAILFGFLWLLRRLAPGRMGAQGVVRVVGGVMVGPRERVVVVEVGDDWLLVGVAAGHVSHLHTLPKPPGMSVAPDLPFPSPFAGKLAELLSRRKQS